MSTPSAGTSVRLAAPDLIDSSSISIVRPHAAIDELVQHFRVCCVILPEPTSGEDEKRQVEFLLELHGTHEQSGEHPTRDCQHCLRAYAALRVIADWIFPHEARPSNCEVEIYAPFITNSFPRGNRASVKLTVRVVRRAGGDRLACGCEPHCLEEITSRLKALGASELNVQHVRAWYAMGG